MGLKKESLAYPISQDVVVEFGMEDLVHIYCPQTDALVIKAEIGGYII